MNPSPTTGDSADAPAGQGVQIGGPEVSRPLLYTLDPESTIDDEEFSDEEPSPRDDSFLAQFYQLTAGTTAHPFDPKSWWVRAELFLDHGFPELACADAYKAQLLCDPQTRAELEARARIRPIMHKALQELGLFSEAEEWAEATLSANEGTSTPSPSGHGDRPRLKRHEYPWLRDFLQPRNIKLISKGLDKSKLQLKKASFTRDRTVLGMFAKSEITASQNFVSDKIYGVAIPDDLPKDEDHAMQLTNTIMYDVPRWQNKNGGGSINLLDLGAIACLTVSYDVPADLFSYKRLVKDIAVKLHNMDKLYDPDYDFWKIFTIHWRICTNHFESQVAKDTVARSDQSDADDADNTNDQADAGDAAGSSDDSSAMTQVVGIAPIFSFFNHSCRPNAEWGLDSVQEENAAIHYMNVKALKKIAAGSEIFISYLNAEEMKKPLDERRQILQAWFGGDCQCEKCKKEEEAQ